MYDIHAQRRHSLVELHLIPSTFQIQLTPAQLQAIQMQLQGKQTNQNVIIQQGAQPAVQTVSADSQFNQVNNFFLKVVTKASLLPLFGKTQKIDLI